MSSAVIKKLGRCTVKAGRPGRRVGSAAAQWRSGRDLAQSSSLTLY